MNFDASLRLRLLLLVAVAATFLVGGCATQTTRRAMHPKFYPKGEYSIGNLSNTVVVLKVVDNRTRKVAEVFRDAQGNEHENLEGEERSPLGAGNSSRQIVQDAVKAALQQAGGQVAGDSALEMQVAIKEFKLRGGISRLRDLNKEVSSWVKAVIPLVGIAEAAKGRYEIEMLPAKADVAFDVSISQGQKSLLHREFAGNSTKNIPNFFAGHDPYLTAVFQRSEEAFSEALTAAILQIFGNNEVNYAMRTGEAPSSSTAIATAPKNESELSPQPRPDEPSPLIWRPSKFRQVWVLAIGIENYREKELVPALPFAGEDAQRFGNWFLQPGTGVSRENVHVLLNESVTAKSVLEEIDWLRKQALPEDAVFVYFAGHGAPELSSDGKSVEAKYLLLHDTNPKQFFATGLAIDDLTRKLDAVKAKAQVVVLEACYAGSVGQEIMKRTPPADLEIRPKLIQQLGERSGRTILSASSGRQIAIGADDLKGGLFTHYLLRSWGDGTRPLLSEGFEEAREQVRRSANRLGSTQEPAKSGDRNLDILFR